MPTFGESGDLATCSFCGRSRKQVAKLIAGPGVYICDECTGLCDAIIDEEGIAAERRGFISARSEMTSPSADGASAAEGRASVIEGWASLTGRLGRGPTVAELATEPGLDEDAKPRSLAGHRLREQLGRLPA